MHISLFSTDARVFTEDLWGFFAQSAMLSIRSEICNGKDCYVIKYAPVNELYVEKETGLVIKAIEGRVIKEDGTTYSNIAEYYHEFNNVDDSVFIEPNIE